MTARQFKSRKVLARGAGPAVVVALAVGVGWPSPVQAQRAEMVNLSHTFPAGPYSAIAVDPADPDRIAVATDKGEVAVSTDGGISATEMNAIIHRRYDAMAIRAGSRAGLSRARPTGTRATRLFLYQLREGLPTPRWAHWMAVGEPVTTISDVALPPQEHGNLFIAGPHGILVGQEGGIAFQRLLGGPGPMQREDDMMGLSVVIDPADPSHIIASTDRGVYQSFNYGATFSLIRQRVMRDRFIGRWFWDPQNPDLLFAIDTYEVLLSDDRGQTFESVFAAGAVIHDVSMAGESVYISTDEGLYIVGPEGTRHLLQKHKILGAVGREDGSTIAITKDTLWWIGPSDETIRIAMTSTTDPYMRLVGTGAQAWLLSKHTVLRLGPPLPRRRAPGYRPPRLAMSLAQVERAVLRHTGLGKPKKTRLRERWFANFLPRVEVQVYGQLEKSDQILFDPTITRGFTNAYALQKDEVTWSVMAFWDLTNLVPTSNASNPYSFIESNLRANRAAILQEIRWRYRECAALVTQLRNPPADPMLATAWRYRLAEYASYLEFMSGAEILAEPID